MPIYRLDARSHAFPDPEEATEFGGLLAIGGDFCVERLVHAYTHGIFPWPIEEVPRAWWSPDPRFVLYPGMLRVPGSLERVLKKERFTYTIDHSFERIIEQCRLKKRPDQEGTWITKELMQAYCALHRAGFAHSVEAWQEGALVGGLYGVSLGRCFYGESMFTLVPDASKCAFVNLVCALKAQGCRLIDCQVKTEHLARFGAQEVTRRRFLKDLASALDPALGVLDWKKMAVSWADGTGCGTAAHVDGCIYEPEM